MKAATATAIVAIHTRVSKLIDDVAPEPVLVALLWVELAILFAVKLPLLAEGIPEGLDPTMVVNVLVDDVVEGVVPA